MLSQRDGGRGGESASLKQGRVREVISCTQDTGSAEGWVWGGQKADQQGFREQKPVGWDGGPKRETRGAIGESMNQIGGSRSQDMPGLGAGRGADVEIVSTLSGVTPLPFLPPRFQFFPPPRLLERH